jgi:hypothetical protein
MALKFSKNRVSTWKQMGAAGRALERRLSIWLGRLRKRVQRNERKLETTIPRVDELSIKLMLLDNRVELLQNEIKVLKQAATEVK